MSSLRVSTDLIHQNGGLTLENRQVQTANCKIEAEIINFWTEGDGDAVSTATPHISTTPDSEFWKEKDFGGRHFEFRVSASVIAETGVVVSIGVAGAISVVVVISFLKLISNNFRFSGRHIGFLECDKYGLIATSCSQILFRKSRDEGASLNSMWFGNGGKKSGQRGAIYPPSTPFTV